MARKIRKGDTVMVLSGKDKGKTGEVVRVIPKEDKVVVRGVNVVKRHQRPNAQMRQGGIIEKESPIYACKVALVCPSCGKATRVGFRFLEDGTKVRYCKKCGEVIDK
ncbi:50S ribosomal protein L24 [Thermosipho africanus H17ap60334]|uniref:Large ribosomal subunit protein uL24 n=1 Tax=Thermosipho africanus (strain TCF52B) TaxID=484019 RepID=RL24_THEAB|nr:MULTISPECIES: 50S ribosomal protein L24 [Thermosipho]B7IHV7.1 RecName: Full=Large ribosomal subunit protein uL24; AltName: Full=50S ribosomal protein L24 [Thermosipho africanus TCF52B]HCF38478.1 50S ribosomal protein L24 [Thermosipho africanus]ACJ75671.1 ribosomal protein L24 [Thermosipho africanus TCF52B]EKF49694.1 50S ribosomal protein L24 [Thermosipho africanus H17ap60334]MBZ4650533.1 rplX [Thermosipho sp. (in: thermotogales)]MDK2839138.1 large subunit ribosomal protein [Thermosipho sp.